MSCSNSNHSHVIMDIIKNITNTRNQQQIALHSMWMYFYLFSPLFSLVSTSSLFVLDIVFAPQLSSLEFKLAKESST